VREMAGYKLRAVRAYRLYLAAAPETPDRCEVEDTIRSLESQLQGAGEGER